MRRRHAVLPLASCMLCVAAWLASCGRSTKAKDLLYSQFQTSVVDMPYDHMAFVGEDSLWNAHASYIYVHYMDSINCSSCLGTRLAVWQMFEKRLESVSDSCALCFIVEGDTSTIRLIREVEYYTQYSPAMYVDTAGIFLGKNPLVDSLHILRSFMIDNRGKVLLIGDPTKTDLTQAIKEAVSQQKQ